MISLKNLKRIIIVCCIVTAIILFAAITKTVLFSSAEEYDAQITKINLGGDEDENTYIHVNYTYQGKMYDSYFATQEHRLLKPGDTVKIRIHSSNPQYIYTIEELTGLWTFFVVSGGALFLLIFIYRLRKKTEAINPKATSYLDLPGVSLTKTPFRNDSR